MKTGKTSALKSSNLVDYELLTEGEAFIVHDIKKKTETLMAEARYLLYTCKRAKPLKVMFLPLTSPNI